MSLAKWRELVGQQADRGSAKVTFYPGLETLPVLIAQLKSVRNAWVAWPAMIEEAARSRLMEVPIDRLLLLDPQSCFLPAFAAAYDAPAIKFAEGIRDATRSADYAHISVRWFDGPIFSVILADPRDEMGWARIEIPIPYHPSKARPSLRFGKRDYPGLFRVLTDAYNGMWEKGREPRKIS